MRGEARYVKGKVERLEPVWVRSGGSNYKHTEFDCAEDAAKLDEPEGTLIVEVSATLYAEMVKIANHAFRLANKVEAIVDPLAGRRGPRGKL